MHEGPKDIWFGCTVKEFGVFIASLLYTGCYRSASSQLLLLLKSVLGLCALPHAAGCAVCTNGFLCWNSLHGKKKKRNSPTHVTKFVPCGCLSVFSYFSVFENISQAKRK